MNTGDLSTLLVWAAATAFTIALVAYTIDLARLADNAQRRRPELDAEAGEDRAGVPATVAVGSAGAASPVSQHLGSGSGPVTRSASASAIAGSADEAAIGRSPRAEGIARSTTYLGCVLLFAAIVLRGIAAGRWPTANMYEFTLVGVFVATTVLAVVQRRRVIAFLGVVVMGIAVTALVVAIESFFVRADAVRPALQNYWLVLHVGVAIIATGIFTVAFATAVLQVLRYGRETGRSHLDHPWKSADGVRQSISGLAVTGPRLRWLDQVPDSRRLEALSFRLNALAFVLWTLTLIGGAIWAEDAWGRYWNWDSKEVGTFVAWVVYAAYLHARTTRGWSGSKAAYFVFVGYAVVLANFTVVNLVIPGLHSYAF
ncbi:cytochrome C biogenesis protein CcsB [Cellulomonas sp. A375-1]|uniref:c-type cytochrome biogenesis protein CcsB n=1 Tax=Cellulomonas sp. A375-1 TaxID=1672219 RepID=UPI00065283AB|nr:c-type cytochrome biogenesis protein CcsB [Cellulomonas sp. A375-1]KMM45546.1 cytochrome C biogenesis protein CcsB [Cellulomonas sp. A375-1]